MGVWKASRREEVCVAASHVDDTVGLAPGAVDDAHSSVAAAEVNGGTRRRSVARIVLVLDDDLILEGHANGNYHSAPGTVAICADVHAGWG